MADETAHRQGQPKEDGSSASGSSSSTLRNIVTTGIRHPGKNDVMFGRGGDTNYHIGNHRFRMMADKFTKSYREASRKEKAVIVQELVDSWRAEDPPGRFLTRTDPSKGDQSLWHDAGEEMALKKAAKILTERASAEMKAEQKGAPGKKRQARTSSASPSSERAPRQRQQQQQQYPQQQQQRHFPQQQQQQHAYPPFASYQPYPSVGSLTQSGLEPPHVGGMFSGGSTGMLPMRLPGSHTNVPATNGLWPEVFSAGTPVQQLRITGMGMQSGNGTTRGTTARGGTLEAKEASPPEAGAGNSEGKDDSPPIEEGAAVAIPSAAALSNVFNSSSSSEKPGGGSPSTDESK